jgi:glycosyltransferase involved in cell wall biosynthesis
MKILQISSVPVTYAGGTEKVVLELSKELSKRHDVTILQTNLYEEKKDYQKIGHIEKVKIITCKNDKFLGGFGYSKEFKKVLKRIYKKFDLIHIHGHGRFTSDFTMRYVGKKKPLIYTAHGFFHSSKGGKVKKLYNKWFKLKKGKIEFFTALTELEKKQYLKLGVKKNKIKILPNWVDLKKFQHKKDKKYIDKLFKNSKNKTLLFVGRLHESKGIQYALKAIKNLEINFLVVGRDAGYKKYLDQIIEKNNLKEKVKIIEGISEKDLMKTYNSSDFFVLFSEWEGFGIVVLEAMASKLPVIVSNRGALPLLIKDNENGLISEFPSIKSLKNKLTKIIEDEKLRKKIIKNSVEFVKKFNTPKIIKEYEELYKNAIKK